MFKDSSLSCFFVASCGPSFDLRRPKRELGRFSTASSVAGLVSFVGASVGASVGAVIGLESSFGWLGVLEEECLRWCKYVGEPFTACEVFAMVEQEKHIHGLLRTIWLE